MIHGCGLIGCLVGGVFDDGCRVESLVVIGGVGNLVVFFQ